MSRSKFGRFIDNVVITLIVFLISFALLKTLIISNWVCVIVALIFCFCVLKIILYFQNKKYNKLSIEKNEVKKIDECNFELRKMSEDKQISFFKNMLAKLEVTKKNKLLIVQNKIAINVNLFNDKLESQDIYKIYSKIQNLQTEKIQEVVIICNSVPIEIINLTNRFNNLKFTFFSPIETYALMKKFYYFPSLSTPNKAKKHTKMAIVKQAFMHKHAKNFIRCGLLLYLAGLFVPFTKYYIISASICLLIGAICLCFGQKESVVNPLSKQILLE